MDWFKHSTGSHDDPDISDAWDELGEFGYVGFFVILELYGQEYSHRDSEDFITISKTFLRRKLRKSWTKVELLLDFYQNKCQNKNRIISKNNGHSISIKVPKFISLASNWTRRLHTEVTTEVTTRRKEVEVEVEKEEKKIKDKDSCGEPEKEPDSPPEIVFIELPLNDKTAFPVTEMIIEELTPLYPAVDIEQQFREMKGWLLADTTRLKTKRGIKRFYTGWLAKEQNKGRHNGYSQKNPYVFHNE